MNDAVAWKPRMSLAVLHQRAKLLAAIRQFFARRDVLEIETPVLCQFGVSSPHIHNFRVSPGGGYLQTSPEYAMKRVVAAYHCDCFQVCKAFRASERGSYHNPEFSLLEWYRLNFTLQQLEAEALDLIHSVIGQELPITRYSYAQLFQMYCEVDPFEDSVSCLKDKSSIYIEHYFDSQERDDYLDLLFSHCIEPHLGLTDSGQPTLAVVYDFPASQAALSQVHILDGHPVAKRFEIYSNGLELANAFCELRDPDILSQRWQSNNAQRRDKGLPIVEDDHYLLAAQTHGLPECVGIALGIDRLLMCITGKQSIEDVICFPSEIA